jgi:hypothetical protein
MARHLVNIQRPSNAHLSNLFVPCCPLNFLNCSYNSTLLVCACVCVAHSWLPLTDQQLTTAEWCIPVSYVLAYIKYRQYGQSRGCWILSCNAFLLQSYLKPLFNCSAQQRHKFGWADSCLFLPVFQNCVAECGSQKVLASFWLVTDKICLVLKGVLS